MSSSSVVRTWLISACLGLCACAAEHHSTETGNPPFIDSALVTLSMAEDDTVHITGSDGAVTPGGAEVSARNLTSDRVARTKSESNGSFELTVDGTLDDVFELRAGSGKTASAALFVDRDGAGTDGDGGMSTGDAGMLTCQEREQAAAERITAVAEHADVACSRGADCVRVSTSSACHDQCGEAIVSQTGQAEIEAAVSALADGVCKAYADDGCVLIAPPCIPPAPGTPACVQGKCELGPRLDSAVDVVNHAAWCDDRVSQAGAELANAVAGAERGCTTSSDCTVAREITDCAGGCTADPVSLTGAELVTATIEAINAGVCANFEGDGCQRAGQPPCSMPPIECRANLCQFAVEGLTCEARGTEAQTRLNAAVDSADSSCTTVDDCVSASTSTGCFGSCGTLVSVQGRAEIDAAIAEIDADVCANFQGDGCPYAMPQCAAPPGPIACVDGTCGYE